MRHVYWRLGRINLWDQFAFDDIKEEHIYLAFEEIEGIFTTLEQAALDDIPIAPYLPEPKSLRDILRLPCRHWLLLAS